MLLLRHARAGERLPTEARDAQRGLDRDGRVQAARLPDWLARFDIERIVSSPLVRCVETVAPLAEALGLEVETRDELLPDTPRSDVLRLLRELPANALGCTHREVFETLFAGIACEKGGAWVVERRDRIFRPVAYLPPLEVHPVRRPSAARR